MIPNESSDQEESFKYVFAGRVSSVSSPFAKIAKQLPGWDRKWSCLWKKKCNRWKNFWKELVLLLDYSWGTWMVTLECSQNRPRIGYLSIIGVKIIENGVSKSTGGTKHFGFIIENQGGYETVSSLLTMGVRNISVLKIQVWNTFSRSKHRYETSLDF